MTTKPLHWQDITQDPLVVRIKDAGAEAIAKTDTWKKRYNSYTSAAQVILQLANLLVFVNFDIPWWASVILALVIGAAEVVMQARTKTPVTPHVVAQLTEVAERKVMQERFAEAPAPTPATPRPVVPGLSSGLPYFDRE
ncbi:hypothetical protein NYP18_09280 [Corynebacterium sp. YIM 101645]|uniref:Holin n=1 Tax=Corynebacterium lemuris TaxID=1859292 RepID=A0ABT2FX83_9CORY|nr:hypothetical protein [Corynebacterium lemuris]MCS5479851.1 hypothetical protein [Corynebacterium lemuris]